MNADVLLQQVSIAENGTSLKTCPGLVLVNWLPPGNVQAANPGGRKVPLEDDMQFQLPNDYRDQFEMRAAVTGKTWLEVQIVSMHDFGLLGDLMGEIIDLAKKSWPLPLGSSLLDNISDEVKKGAPQVIASGRSEIFLAENLPASITISLTAPSDVLGEMSNLDPITHMPTDQPAQRPVLLAKGSPNGAVTLSVVPA